MQFESASRNNEVVKRVRRVSVINEPRAEDTTNPIDHPATAATRNSIIMTGSHSSCQIRSNPAQYMHLSDGLLYVLKTPGSSNGKRGWHFGLPIDDTPLLPLLHRSPTNIPSIYDTSRLMPYEPTLAGGCSLSELDTPRTRKRVRGAQYPRSSLRIPLEILRSG